MLRQKRPPFLLPLFLLPPFPLLFILHDCSPIPQNPFHPPGSLEHPAKQQETYRRNEEEDERCFGRRKRMRRLCRLLCGRRVAEEVRERHFVGGGVDGCWCWCWR